MTLTRNALLLAGVLVAATATVAPGAPTAASAFDDYAKAYHAAREAGRPLLVILNPAADADAPQISLEKVSADAQRRELLKSYVVVVVDGGTPAGKKTHELFGAPMLPRVVVIDREQQYQLYSTSATLDPVTWNEVLATYRDGVRPATVQPAAAWCYT